MEIKLYDTDYVRTINGKIVDDLDTIYSKSSLVEMIQDMRLNNKKLLKNEKYVKMTSLTKEQQKKYIDFLKNKK